MALWNWSPTAANNASADPTIDWQEGQAPSTVNDSARAMMAAIATWFQSAEWLNLGDTPSYVNGTTFTVPNNRTSAYPIGRRVRTFNTGGTLYGTILASVYTSLTTVTLVMDSGSLDSGLSEVDVGIVTPGKSLLPGLTGFQFLTGSGTYNPGPAAASAIVLGGGGGGAGGGTIATTSNTVCAGSGGGSGAFGAILIPRGSLSSQSYVCGAGGTGVSGAAGNSGGQSNFGSLLVLPGGNGGNVGKLNGGTNANDVSATPPALPTAPSGSGIFLFSNQGQSGSAALDLLNPLGGSGGNSLFGSGGPGSSAGGGSAGAGYCSGGAGSARVGSFAASAGFNGANAAFLVLELA